MTTKPVCKEDFTHISKPDGYCYLCSHRGVVLAYDIYAPMIGMWFCEHDWHTLNSPIPASFLVQVQDTREKETAS